MSIKTTYKQKSSNQSLIKENPSPVISSHLDVNKIYNMDCFDGMKQLFDNCIDLVITDPPFAIDFKAKRSNYNRTQSRVLEGYCEISKDKYYCKSYEWRVS